MRLVEAGLVRRSDEVSLECLELAHVHVEILAFDVGIDEDLDAHDDRHDDRRSRDRRSSG